METPIEEALDEIEAWNVDSKLADDLDEEPRWLAAWHEGLAR